MWSGKDDVNNVMAVEAPGRVQVARSDGAHNMKAKRRAVGAWVRGRPLEGVHDGIGRRCRSYDSTFDKLEQRQMNSLPVVVRATYSPGASCAPRSGRIRYRFLACWYESGVWRAR